MNLTQLFVGSLGLLFTGLSSAAPLQNGDFGSFEGWSGERYFSCPPPNYFCSSTISGNALDNTADTDDNFQRDAADGTGTAINSSDYLDVELFQEFTVPDAGGGSVWLSFDYGWSISDSSWDVVSIALLDTAENILVDLIANPWRSPIIEADSGSGAGSLSYDMTGYSNQDVILSAFIANGDFDDTDASYPPIVGDSVTIGNIALKQVPVPPTVLLLLAGFPLILHWRVRKKQ